MCVGSLQRQVAFLVVLGDIIYNLCKKYLKVIYIVHVTKDIQGEVPCNVLHTLGRRKQFYSVTKSI